MTPAELEQRLLAALESNGGGVVTGELAYQVGVTDAEVQAAMLELLYDCRVDVWAWTLPKEPA